MNIIPVNNWKYAVRLPAVSHPLRPHPLYCFTWGSNAQRDLHIYHRKVFTKKISMWLSWEAAEGPNCMFPCASARRFISNLLFIREERERDWDGVLWSGKQSLLFSLQLNRIHMTQAWHGGRFHVMCSLSFCFPRLWMLVGMGIALEKSGYPLQPSAAGAQCEEVEGFLVMVVGNPGWANCCSHVARNSRVVFHVAGACGERAVSLGLLQALHGHFCPFLEPLSCAPWALSSAWPELSPLSPQVEGSSASVQHLGWQSVL